MSLYKYLQQLDSKYKYSSVLDYENDELFTKLLEYNNYALLGYIEQHPHLINKLLIIKNNITIPKELRGRVHLISNYIKKILI